MRVRIDAAGQHVAAARVELARAGDRLADGDDVAVLDQHVGAVEHAAGRDDAAAGDAQRRHAGSSHATTAPARTTLRATRRSLGVLGDVVREAVLAVGEREAAALQLEQAEVARRARGERAEARRARRARGACADARRSRPR